MRLTEKVFTCLPWLPAYVWQRWTRTATRGSVHLILCLADHFEPSVLPKQGEARASADVQEQRLERWCREIPKALKEWCDSDGFPFRHTYFYPAEQYDPGLIERLAQHCRDGWGEIEVHLHHGTQSPDTPENTRQVLLKFRDALACRGCLSQWDGQGEPRYAFVHGNFALANSGRNQNCGVDAEMKILADTGCYADFTLPSAPNPSQVAKINALYECSLPLERRSPHRQGKDLRLGVAPALFPLIIQGPLMWDLSRRKYGLPYPAIENGELTASHPATAERLSMWHRAAITVVGRPDWVFIKLHCHGMDPRDEAAIFGEPMKRFLRGIVEGAKSTGEYQVHFTTAREMTNIILAACDGREGNPGNFRNYRLTPFRSRRLLRPSGVAPQVHHEKALNTCAE
jgi:hypothetical protein